MLKQFVPNREFDDLPEAVQEHYRPIEGGHVLEVEQGFSPTLEEIIAELFEGAQ